MQVKISQAASMVTSLIKAKLVPMIHGSPAVGKSAIGQQIAKEYNLKLIDMRLSQCDPTDLLGFPFVKEGRAGYAPMDSFPLEGDEVPAGYNGWLLFLDELNSASQAVQAASYKVILDRMVGAHKLHPKVAIIAAGNLETDNAIVQPMSTALQSRLVHLELVADAQEWIKWASANDIDYRITSFIEFKPSNLYTFSPDHTDKTYASPRTWEFADRIMKVTVDVASKESLALLSGTLSEGVAREFMAFCKIHDELPTISEIVANPENIKMPNEPSILYALTGSVGSNAEPQNIKALLKFINRMPAEFQVVTLREAIRRNKALMADPEMQAWINKNANQLF